MNKRRYTLPFTTVYYYSFYIGMKERELRIELNKQDLYIRFELWGCGFYALQIGKKCLLITAPKG